MNATYFYANGKLLLSGEYFVLDGARSIGLPCKLGQSLEATILNKEDFIYWESKTMDDASWFEGTFRISDFSIHFASDQKIAETLSEILKQARQLNPDFLKTNQALQVKTRLEFPRLWGLGSSSTLIYSIAQWSKVDPFKLSSKTIGGSGYDIACAGSKDPVLYQLMDGQPVFQTINYNPEFKSQLFFIYLSQKQNSREGINRYRNKARVSRTLIDEISNLTDDLLKANSLKEFQKIITYHEQIVSRTIEMSQVKDLYFFDFEGAVKSLGAWGGDFILAATELPESQAKEYFNKKGFGTFLRYDEIIK